jgi:hypothetical protein
MSKLKISSSLSLPVDAVTQKFGILGRTGSGKSYGASKLAEEMLDAKAQIVALDPVGVWWGLRVAADGKTPAYSIPVFGGMHGDIPLEPTGGALIADIIVDYGTSAVIDLSNFLLTEQRKFATDFATQIFHRKKTQRSPVHIFFEEAQEFVPQQVRGDVAKMVGAFERLIKLGRNFGIGATLISQRPQSVNKDVLNQTECLLAFQMTGPQERKTIENWIAEKGVDEDIAGDLPHLKVGQCHIWSPQWLQISETIKIDKKKTADVSSTPQHGAAKKIEPKELSSADLAKLQEKMAATIERAKKEDPKELQKQVAQLKADLAKRDRDKPAAPAPKIKEVLVLKDSQLARVEKLFEKLNKFRELENDRAHKFLKPVIDTVTEISRAIASVKFANTEPRSVSPSPAVAKRIGASEGPERGGHKPLMRNRSEHITSRSPIGSTAGDNISPGGGLRRIMIALAQHPNGLSQSQIGVFAGLSSKGGTFSTYLSRARSNGWIYGEKNLVAITQAGIEALGAFEMLPTGELLYQYWLAKLGNSGAARILQALHDCYPSALTKDEIGERAQISSAGGSFSTYLSRLRSLELISGTREIQASAELFES